MTPFIALVVVSWININPASPTGAVVVWRDVFPDRQICEIALAERVAEIADAYDGLDVEIEGRCVSTAPPA